MGETSEFEVLVSGNSGIPIRLGGEKQHLHSANTTIWRHGYEDRHFDHCVVKLEGELVRFFGPGSDFLQDLEEGIGCPVVKFDTADVETRIAYQEWVIGGIDDLHQTA